MTIRTLCNRIREILKGRQPENSYDPGMKVYFELVLSIAYELKKNEIKPPQHVPQDLSQRIQTAKEYSMARMNALQILLSNTSQYMGKILHTHPLNAKSRYMLDDLEESVEQAQHVLKRVRTCIENYLEHTQNINV